MNREPREQDSTQSFEPLINADLPRRAQARRVHAD
jgi:hypothetical protein